MPFFERIPWVPEDPILGLTAIFNEDTKDQKVNLGVGTYRTAEGLPLVLSCVKKAEALLFQENLDKEYIPISGNSAYIEETRKLLFGKYSLVADKTFGAQTLGGSGALRLGGEFLASQKFKIYLPNPTWSNHEGIFGRVGLEYLTYPYYNKEKHEIDFDAWCDAIDHMEPQSAILLHGCCHNPTGMDPTREQWKELSQLIMKRGIFPFFDIAYQGFDRNLEEDAWVLRLFASQGHAFFVASSYSKNMGLYNERVGAFFFVGQTIPIRDRLGSQIKGLIRGNYSTPPAHGERIVTKILTTPELYEEWTEELTGMSSRIHKMRHALADKLAVVRPDLDFSFLHQQKGIFSFSGLDMDQVQVLRHHFGIYLLSNGRINVAGLNESNLDYVVESFAAVLV